MTTWGKVLGTCAVTAAVALAAGCGSGGGHTPASPSATSTLAADVPVGFDPCRDIPQAVQDSLQIHGKEPDKLRAHGGIVWRGCGWVKSDYYALSIDTTNLTVAMVRDQHYQDQQEFTIAGRQAISTRQVPEHPLLQCTINVAMTGGSVEFFLSNSNSDRIVGDRDSCHMVRDVAEQVVPTIPPGV